MFRSYKLRNIALSNLSPYPLQGERSLVQPEQVTLGHLHVDEPGVALGAIPDEPARTQARKIYPDGDAFADIGVIGVDQALTTPRSASHGHAGNGSATAATLHAPERETCAG